MRAHANHDYERKLVRDADLVIRTVLQEPRRTVFVDGRVYLADMATLVAYRDMLARMVADRKSYPERRARYQRMVAMFVVFPPVEPATWNDLRRLARVVNAIRAALLP